MDRQEATQPDYRHEFRASDGPATSIGELSPDDFGRRVVIRSKDFLGTVIGTLIGIRDARMVHFTAVQLEGKKELTFRNDTPTLVVD